MNEMSGILSDPREIEAIWYPGDDACGWSTNQKVGRDFRCEKIVAYGENGHMATIPYFAVYRAGEIFARVPAWMVEVRYELVLAHE